MSNAPLLVGMTGGIGSGKTTVCKIFEVLGIPIYYADDEAKHLMNTDSEVINQVTKLFGKNAYIQGQLNRKEVARQAFSDPSLLAPLNQIVHPAVRKDFESWTKRQTDARYLIKEAALLVETGSYKELDRLILVSAPEELRIRRVLQRDPHRTEEDVRKIISEQLPEQDKRKVADYIIENDETSSLIESTLTINQQLTSDKNG